VSVWFVFFFFCCCCCFFAAAKCVRASSKNISASVLRAVLDGPNAEAEWNAAHSGNSAAIEKWCIARFCVVAVGCVDRFLTRFVP
jgi:hypothetical protein